MAYRFTAGSDGVRFAIDPLSGYTAGAWTAAMFFKRASLGLDIFMDITDSGNSDRILTPYCSSGNVPILWKNGSPSQSFLSLTDTSLWYLLVITMAAGAVNPRFHLHNGTSWVHSDGPSGANSNVTIAATDRIWVGKGGSSDAFGGDMVCAGIKKSDSTDAQVESLSRTSFQAWRDFGFDWLIGFDASLEAAGILQDQGVAGTGDEVAITGTSAVADPPGWSWAAAPSLTWFGGTGGASDGTLGAFQIAGQAFTAPVSGTVRQGRVWLGSGEAGNVSITVGIYANSGGVPGALLGQSDPLVLAHPAALSLCAIRFSTPVAVVAGTSYFLATWSPSLSHKVRRDPGVGTSYYRNDVSPIPNPFGTASSFAGYQPNIEAGIEGVAATFVPQIVVI